MEREYIMQSRNWERDFLAHYSLDASMFERLGLKIRQIIPVRSIFRLETDKGMFCLKKTKFPPEETTYVFEAVEHLKNNGFPNVLDVVRQPDGNRIFEYDGNFYFLTEWIDGRESDYLNPMDLQEATEAMALMHLSSIGFKPEYEPTLRNQLGKWVQNFRSRIEEMTWIRSKIQVQATQSEMDRLFLEGVDKSIEDAMLSINYLHMSEYWKLVRQADEEKGFIHHDFAHHNVLHTFDGRTYLVDFDFCIRDIFMHDLGSLIIRNLKKTGWDTEKAAFILDCYNRIKPISMEERHVLLPLMLFPQDFWQLTRQYYIEKKEWGEQEYIEKMQEKTEHMQLKQQFIKEYTTFLA